jgi:hypothetical protein
MRGGAELQEKARAQTTTWVQDGGEIQSIVASLRHLLGNGSTIRKFGVIYGRRGAVRDQRMQAELEWIGILFSRYGNCGRV